MQDTVLSVDAVFDAERERFSCAQEYRIYEDRQYRRCARLCL